MSNGTPSYVELRFFTPFDIYKIPESILESVYEQAIGLSFRKDIAIMQQQDPAGRLSLQELLLAIVDDVELINGIRKELIKYYSQ